MIDFRKNMKTKALNKADLSCFSIYFRLTTVKLDQKSNLNIYCILFRTSFVHFTTIKNMVVVPIATIINSAINHVLNGSCLLISRRETNSEANSRFPFNLNLAERLNEA